MSNRAWVTLATNDSYGLGALVLAHSLRRVGSTHPTVVLITPSLTDAMRDRLRAVFTEVVTVDVLDSRDATHLALLQRPELGITFTKIHCWGLTQYEKCVFLDADTLVVQNCDELFDREELSAAPDVGWPDCFNSGVFVYKPSTATFDALIKFAQERGSFDGGDQGLLNSFFSDWARGDINKHLPFLYNVTSAAFYSYLPALQHYGQDLKIIHFIGAAKPWLQQYNWESRTVNAPGHLSELLQLWWDLFVGQVHQQLDATMVEDVEVEAPPAIPSDVGYYTPDLDPDSEFPWHHPEAQLKDNNQDKPALDLSQFYDPWQNYRGTIPPNNDPEVSDDRQALREYAWDYKLQEQAFNTWQNPRHSHDSPNWHHEPTHHQTHSHDHWEDHSNNHSRGHHPNKHDSWHQEHEAGQFFTSHEHNTQSEHHSSPQGHHDGHSQYPHDHHYDHKSHHYHDHNSAEQTQQHESSKQYRSDHHQDISHKRVEPVTSRSRLHIHHVHIDHQNRPNVKKRVVKSGVPLTNGMTGDASKTSGDDEDIIPRHPYDNYFLKHRATVDSYGRKICSHEVPPTPTRYISPPEWSSPEEEFESPPEFDNQSGVAGNLARVVPGSAQRDAVDELTRRQGWEAGNIDYMGADSFDNIWAKISQTLNQPRSSPPKQASPPKQPSPPKESAKQPSPPKESAKQPSPPKESAKQTSPPKEPVKQPSPPKQQSPPKEPAPKQPSPPKESAQAEPKPIEKPVEAPEQATEAAGKETPVAPSAEAPAPVEAPAPIATPTPEAPAAPAPVEAPAAPTPIQAPAAPASVQAPAAPAPLEALAAPTPIQAPAAPASVQAPAAPASVETPAAPAPAAVQAPETQPQAVAEAPAEAKAAPVAAQAEPPKEKTDKIKVPPTPPATPKTTPEPEVPPVLEAKQAVPEAKLEPASPVAQSPVVPAASTPEKTLEASSSDSPPLANTPSKEQAPIVPAAQSERKKPAGRLQLSPPAAADPLATPDSELEDAAALAQSIIAGELQVTAPTPPAPTSPPATTTDERLSVAEPTLPTPPVGAVSLAQIGVKPKPKSTAAQIASSVAEPAAPATPKTPGAPTTPTKPGTPATPKTPDTPATPKTEGAPASPKTPGTPVTPQTAGAPATPTKPDTPVAPQTPDAPATPTKPDTPVAPQTPDAPATPTKPDTPVAPQTAGAPATPTKPGTPSTPKTPTTPVPPAPTAAEPATPSAPTTPTTPDTPTTPEASKDATKKKIVKKVVKKEGEAPVPPPRKKEKKPKDK